MKTNILFISVIFLFATSCSDSFLDRTSLNNISEDTFWKTEEDALLGLAGCYDTFQSMYYEGPWGIGIMQYEAITDNAYFGWGHSLDDICRGIHTPQTGVIYDFFKMHYKGIARCNKFITNVESMVFDEAKKRRMLAEVKVLRANHYMHLSMTFGDVPLITEPQTVINANVPKTSRESIVSFIINDLKEAATALPTQDRIAGGEYGRLSKGAALGLLARVYLYNDMFTEAAKAAKDVIDMNYYELYPDYGRLFTPEAEQSKEIIMSACFERGIKPREGTRIGRWKGIVPPPFIVPLPDLLDDYYCIDGLPIDKSPLFKGDITQQPIYKDNVHNDFLKDTQRYVNRDPRMGFSIITHRTHWIKGEIIENGQVLYDAKNYTLTRCHFRKWVEETDLEMEDMPQDVYTLRYADILLMRAEALVRTGNYDYDEVLGLINQIRQRPTVMMPIVQDVEGKTKRLNSDELFEIIKHERRIELVYEGHRYYDLIRWGELERAWGEIFVPVNLRHYLGQKSLVWPLPEKEIEINDLLEQNELWK